MNLPVTLAGFPAAWRFRGSAGLDAWLGIRPWSERGGVRIVRIASAEHGSEVARAIRQAARGHDDGDSDVQVRIATLEQCRSGLRGLVERLLDLPANLSSGEYFSTAARAFAAWPMVIVLPPDVGVPRLLADTRELVDQVGRIVPHARATFFLLDTPAQPLAADAFDLTVGGLADPVLGDADRREAVLWRAYVHARLAWEAAGDLTRARQWDGRGFQGLAFAAENLLENLLNQCAESTWGTLSAGVQDRIVGYLRRVVGQHGGTVLGGDEQFLLQLGALWRPPGEGQPRPAPWLARALLRAGAASEASFILRGCLVCAPLAREILSRCFDLEARQRAVGWTYCASYRPFPEAEERFRRFKEKQPGSGAEYYPNDCPAAPADAWAFMLFGEFLSSLPLPRHKLALHHDLRNLRNAIAHGHYVSWNMLATLRQIEKQLGA